MRRLAAAAALALLGLVPVPAHATGDSRYYLDCGFNTVAQESLTGSQDRFTGEMYAAIALYSLSNGNVVNATVTCELRVNGVTQASVSRWGSGFVTLAGPVSYVAGDIDDVRLCTIVDFTSDATPTREDCSQTSYLQMPPQEVLDLLNAVFELPGNATGGGYNTGDIGFLSLTSPGHDRASTCAFVRTGGLVTVVGAAARCRLEDSTGAVLYDATGASLRDTVAAGSGPITVCTEGPETGFHCRPGEPLDRVLS